ncbi:MAG: hypothetical protein JNK76_12420 [Planctomycetales bacterium]|nr:hypothetical protein [Planctomycetales bacterium]
MAKVSKSPTPGVPVLGPIFGLLLGPRVRPLLGIAIVVVGGAYWAWSNVRDQVLAEAQYQIGLEQVVVTARPEWIKADVRVEALRNASLDLPLNVLDDQLAERVAKAFEFHPWVAEVRQVKKSLPAQVAVDVVYRKPVCMVELPDRSGLYAVDAAAFLLPSQDFLSEPKKAAAYPRLAGITSMNVGRVGVRWPDPLVQTGVLVAAALEEVWPKLNLARITPTEVEVGQSVPQFELTTRGGTQILWGSAPTTELAGESRAADKIAALLGYARDHGSLEGRNGPQRIDVRTREITVLAAKPKNATAAKKPPEKRK